MRAIFVILILAVVALIAAFQLDLVDLKQTQSASLPKVEAGDGGLRATGGQAPAFDVATGSVEVTNRNATVAVPKVRVEGEARSVAVPSVTIRTAEPPSQTAPKAQ